MAKRRRRKFTTEAKLTTVALTTLGFITGWGVIGHLEQLDNQAKAEAAATPVPQPTTVWSSPTPWPTIAPLSDLNPVPTPYPTLTNIGQALPAGEPPVVNNTNLGGVIPLPTLAPLSALELPDMPVAPPPPPPPPMPAQHQQSGGS